MKPKRRNVRLAIATFLAACLASSLSGYAAENPGSTQKAESSAKSENTQQQDSATASAATKEDVAALKQQLLEQQKEIEDLRQALDQQKHLVEHSLQATQPVPPASTAESAGLPLTSIGQVASTTPLVPSAPIARPSAFPSAAAAAEPIRPLPVDSGGETAKSPLTLAIGDAQFTLGGFMDATAVFRTTNSGGIGTSFGSIPFSGTAPGQLSELRFSAQNSRVTLMATSQVKGFDVKGYTEADFLGNAPANLAVSSNSNTLRMRLYWVQLTKKKFEILAGQSWSLLVPGRNGISPMPSDIFYSQDMDTNYQVGLTWSRSLQFRFVYHPSSIVTAALSFENPQQFVGSVTLPSNFTSSQVDTGSNANAPNMTPDVVGKLAFDPVAGGKHMHIEFAGLLSSFRVWNSAFNSTHSAVGGGGSANFNLEVVKNFHLLLNTFYSDGGGRWLFGLGPDFIVNNEFRPSLVRAGSAIAGFEWQVNPKTMLYGYYGGAYFDRNTSIYVDPTTGKQSLIGYGYAGSPSSQNRSFQEPTFGVIQTFWKDPRYGALQLITQYSYLTRAPWYVAPNTPKNAHASMSWVDVRYVLP